MIVISSDKIFVLMMVMMCVGISIGFMLNLSFFKSMYKDTKESKKEYEDTFLINQGYSLMIDYICEKYEVKYEQLVNETRSHFDSMLDENNKKE